MASPDEKDIESLVELFNQSDWDEMHLKTDDLEIFLSNDPAAIGPTQASAVPATAGTAVATAADAVGVSAAIESAPAASAAAVHVPDGMVAVTAPNLGTFYRAPKPGAAPYVEVGQAIGAETEVCLIEVMKLFTPVSAGTAGVVHEVCIEDGQLVEYGQVLVVIDPK